MGENIVGWICSGCNGVLEGIDDPGKCSKCGESAWRFVSLKDDYKEIAQCMSPERLLKREARP